MNENELEAMASLREMLIPSSVLALPYADGKVALDTNARNMQVECALLHKQHDKTTMPIEYGIVRSQAPNASTKRCNESAFQLSAWFSFLELTSTVHDLQLEPITTHRIEYSTCRRDPEDSRDVAHGYTNSNLMALTESV